MLERLRNENLMSINNSRVKRGILQQSKECIEMFGDLSKQFAYTSNGGNYLEERDTVFPLHLNGSMLTVPQKEENGLNYKYVITPLNDLNKIKVSEKLNIKSLPNEMLKLSMGNVRNKKDFSLKLDERAILSTFDPNVELMIKLSYLRAVEKRVSTLTEIYATVVNVISDCIIDAVLPYREAIQVISYSPWFLYIVSSSPSLTIDGFDIKEVTDSDDCFNWYINVLRDILQD